MNIRVISQDYFDWLKNLTYFGRRRQEIPKKDVSWNNSLVYRINFVAPM